MKLGIALGTGSARYALDMDFILEAERLGFDSIWTSEAWGADAISPAAWILARTTRIKVGTGIIQMPARTPAMAAMTAMTLHQLSGGRFLLGVGPSGPQVVEGWHGVPFGNPLQRTREYVAIIRRILAREAPLEFDGELYRIPYRGEGATGLGKPLRSILHGDPRLPIVTGSFSSAGVRLAAEIADGMIPVFMDPLRFDLFARPLAEGFALAGGGKSLADFRVMPFCGVCIDEDPAVARKPAREHLALYIGGMGAREKNYYNTYARRLGYEADAAKIQDLYLAGKKAQAEAAVPDALIDALTLAGPKAWVVERLQAWKAAAAQGHVDTLLCNVRTKDELRVLAEAVL